MADRWESRTGRTAMAALASLSLAAIACGSSSSLPSVGDGSVGSDAVTQDPDGGSLDASVSSDGGACSVPLAPDLSVIASDEVLKFVAPGGLPIELAVLARGRADRDSGLSTRAAP